MRVHVCLKRRYGLPKGLCTMIDIHNTATVFLFHYLPSPCCPCCVIPLFMRSFRAVWVGVSQKTARDTVCDVYVHFFPWLASSLTLLLSARFFLSCVSFFSSIQHEGRLGKVVVNIGQPHYRRDSSRLTTRRETTGSSSNYGYVLKSVRGTLSLQRHHRS